jgi:hypothetical protein
MRVGKADLNKMLITTRLGYSFVVVISDDIVADIASLEAVEVSMSASSPWR